MTVFTSRRLRDGSRDHAQAPARGRTRVQGSVQGLLLWFLLPLAALPTVAQATEPPATPTNAVVREDPNDPAYRLGKLVRCPVCQGMPIAESPAPMARDMMAQVRRQLAEGKTEQQVLDGFVAAYGEWVLLQPKREGFNWSVWLLPPVLLLIGLAVVLRQLRPATAARTTAKAGTQEPAATAPNTPTPQSDPYLAEVRRRVDGGR